MVDATTLLNTRAFDTQKGCFAKKGAHCLLITTEAMGLFQVLYWHFHPTHHPSIRSNTKACKPLPKNSLSIHDTYLQRHRPRCHNCEELRKASCFGFLFNVRNGASIHHSEHHDRTRNSDTEEAWKSGTKPPNGKFTAWRGFFWPQRCAGILWTLKIKARLQHQEYTDGKETISKAQQQLLIQDARLIFFFKVWWISLQFSSVALPTLPFTMQSSRHVHNLGNRFKPTGRSRTSANRNFSPICNRKSIGPGTGWAGLIQKILQNLKWMAEIVTRLLADASEYHFCFMRKIIKNIV